MCQSRPGGVRFLAPILLSSLALVLAACDPAAKPSESLEVAARSVESGALSSSGRWALIGSGYQGGSLWDLQERERLYNWNHKSEEQTLLTSVSFSPEEDWALSSDGSTLVLWNRQSGAAEQYWSSPAQIVESQLGPDGNRALLGLSDRRASLYQVKRGGILRNFHLSDAVASIALSHDGRWALTGSDAGTATLWDTQTGEPVSHRQHDSPVQLVAISPDGGLLLSASRYQKPSLWTPEGDLVWQLPLGDERIERGAQLSVARFSEDGSYLLTGQGQGLVQLWDLTAEALAYSWRLPKRKAWQPTPVSVVDLAFTQDPNLYRALGSNGLVHDLTY